MIEASYYLPQIKTGNINTRNSDIITNSLKQVFGDKPITIVPVCLVTFHSDRLDSDLRNLE